MLMSASRSNNLAVLEQLLKRPRNPNVTCERGFAPLHHAAEEGHVEPMRLLLEARADAQKAAAGAAPVHFAAANGYFDAVRFLLEVGVDRD